MDSISRRVPSPQTHHFIDDTNSFLVLLIIIWMLMFFTAPFFPRRNQHLHAHCVIILAIIMAVYTHPQYSNEISEIMLEFLQSMLPIMSLYLRIEMDAAARRSRQVPATSHETNY
ncbi:unnamed protein product [Caenorhabditis angaria]|uniref:Uncharacterized protein n=1 Tax=Caenorhabditis angaria TaxID=860376 RepID=A0A9P1IE69_9PELO|nr:unnamed protein product [Caenorhabditis angaria]